MAYEGHQRYSACFVLPNAPIEASVSLTDFLTPLEAMEGAAGFEFPKDETESSLELCRKIVCK